jgi:TPR repeat protein
MASRGPPEASASSSISRQELRSLRRAADRGDALAQLKLGGCYYEGDGVEQDHTEAVRFFLLAADKGRAVALFNLATCFEKGEGVKQNMTEAVRLYRLAADKGHADAQCNLGIRFEKGEGVKQNMTEAVRFYRLAADKGHADAQYNLAICFQKGEGVRQDHAEAVRLFRLAADKDHANAQHNLALCYDKGESVPQDYPEAARLYRLAAKQGYMNSHLALGILLVEGVPGKLPAAPREAALHLATAAQQTDDAPVHTWALTVLSAHAHEREVVAACCIGCGATRKLKLCTRCHVAGFCGKECLARTWPVHKQSCRLWAVAAQGSDAQPAKKGE